MQPNQSPKWRWKLRLERIFFDPFLYFTDSRVKKYEKIRTGITFLSLLLINHVVLNYIVTITLDLNLPFFFNYTGWESLLISLIALCFENYYGRLINIKWRWRLLIFLVAAAVFFLYYQSDFGSWLADIKALIEFLVIIGVIVFAARAWIDDWNDDDTSVAVGTYMGHTVYGEAGDYYYYDENDDSHHVYDEDNIDFFR